MNKTSDSLKSNPGRELFSEFNGKKYARIPVQTHFIKLGEDLNQIIRKYALPELKEGDVLCIATKIVSITNKLVIHKDQVEAGWLAKLITRFVKKWPNDIGYSNPRKMQVAINQAGYPRMILAIVVGSFMKLIGKPGYFYRIAGNQINAIDGFTVGFTERKIFEEYAFLPPKNGDELCEDIEKEFGFACVMLDGNNIDNNVMGMSSKAKQRFSEKDFMEIVSGNPQGQEDDGNNTPILVVRETDSW